MIASLGQDLRYAFRQLRKNPGFAAVAVLTLALGIGGNTAIFSLINAVMLRALPVESPGRLVLLKWKAKSIPKTKASSSYANCPPGSGPALQGGDIVSDVPLDAGGCSFSLPFFQQLESELNIFSNVAAFVPAELSVNSEGRTSRLRGLLVSGDFFSTVGVKPALGRLLDLSDDSEAAVPSMVVSQGFWQSVLGGDRFVAGKQILVGKTWFTVVGVTAPEFAQLDPGLACDVWIPIAFRSRVPPYPPRQTAATALWIELFGRLQPGISSRQAASAISAIFAASTTNGPEAIFRSNEAPQIELSSAARGLATLRRNFSQALLTLFTAVALVLLISSVNIAGLMLARSASRKKELGMRVALGATRGRIISQLLTESLLLSLAGGAIGMVLGDFGARILVSFFSRNWWMPLQLDAHPDTRVFAFTLLISVTAGVAFGLVPAFSRGRQDLVHLLKTDPGVAIGTRHRLPLGSLIVLIQIALAMPLLSGAALIARTLSNLRAEDVGFNPQHLLVFRIDSTYGRKNPQTRYRDLQERLALLPGVASASRSGVALLSNEGIAGPIFSSGEPTTQARAHFLPMSSNFLATVVIPLRQGRIFSDEDSAESHGKDFPTQVVVNERLVQHLFGAQDPLGRYFHLGNASGPAYEIIGVVADAKYGNVRDTIWPTVYAPIGDWNGDMYFEVRTATDPKALIPEIQSAISRFDSNLLIVGMKTETEQIDQDLYQERLISVLSGIFAALALIVACVGLYGLLAFQVARRTQEIGIRLALGAERGDVLQLVLAEGAALAIAGTLIGCAAALFLNRYLESFVFGIKPTDAMTVIAVAVLLIGVAVMASYVPARRAAKVDPMVALRYE
jgi:predicted permease